MYKEELTLGNSQRLMEFILTSHQAGFDTIFTNPSARARYDTRVLVLCEMQSDSSMI